MKIPYRWAELTLGQLQILMTTDDPLRKVCAVTGLTLEQLRAKPQSEVDEALKRIEAIPEVGRHKTKITFENRQWFKKRKKYGFICDWDDFTTGEWIDAQRYVEDFWPNAHKLMAILYRPITWENGDKYAIAKYTAKEDASIFKSMPADLFTVLFAGRDGGTNLLYDKWGWYLSLWALSGEDITKMNAITELPIGVTLQHLAFLKDLEADRKNGIK